jgi:hypothetical protein
VLRGGDSWGRERESLALINSRLNSEADFSSGFSKAVSLFQTEKEIPGPTFKGVKTRMLHALTLLDAPRYPDDFKHFNYMEVNAQKRGTLRTAEVGTFHSGIGTTGTGGSAR